MLKVTGHLVSSEKFSFLSSTVAIDEKFDKQLGKAIILKHQTFSVSLHMQITCMCQILLMKMTVHYIQYDIYHTTYLLMINNL